MVSTGQSDPPSIEIQPPDYSISSILSANWHLKLERRTCQATGARVILFQKMRDAPVDASCFPLFISRIFVNGFQGKFA